MTTTRTGPENYRDAEDMLGRAWDYLYGDHSGREGAELTGIGMALIANARATLALSASVTCQQLGMTPEQRRDWLTAILPSPTQTEVSPDASGQD